MTAPTQTRAYRYLDIAIGDAVMPIYSGNGTPTNGITGTLAGVAVPGSLFLADDGGTVAIYQNTNTQASPTWTAIGISGIDTVLASPPAIGGTAPNTVTGTVVTGTTQVSTPEMVLTGSSSGSTNISAAATADGSLTAPNVTGTLASTSGSNLYIADAYRCTSTQIANANIVPANITGLAAAAVAIGTYRISAKLQCSVASGTAGIAINQVLGGGAVLGVGVFTAKATLAAGIAAQQTTTLTSGTVLFTAADQPLEIDIDGTFTVTTAGTFGLQMCQNTSNASNSEVLVGSEMELVRIA